MEQDNILGNNIRFLRLKNGMSMNDLAGPLDLSGRTSVMAYESGSCNPTIDGLVKISQIFKVSLDDLVLKKLYKNHQHQLKLKT